MPKRRPAPAKPSPSLASPSASNGSKGNGNKRSTPPIKESPFAKKAKNDKKQGQPKIKILHCVPNVSDPKSDAQDETGHEIFIVVIDGYLQKIVTECMYHKNDDPDAALFVEHTDPVLHVFNLCHGYDEVTVVGNNHKTYPVKVLVHALDGDEPASREMLELFVTDTFVPALLTQKDVRKTVKPELHSTEAYTRYDSWSDLLGHGSGILKLFNLNYKDGDERFGDWLKADKANLYSVWKIGEIPTVIKKSYSLTREQMYEPDWAINVDSEEEQDDDDNSDSDDDSNGEPKKQPAKKPAVKPNEKAPAKTKAVTPKGKKANAKNPSSKAPTDGDDNNIDDGEHSAVNDDIAEEQAPVNLSHSFEAESKPNNKNGQPKKN